MEGSAGSRVEREGKADWVKGGRQKGRRTVEGGK